MKKTRCTDCESGLIEGPRGGKKGYWKRTVLWIKDGPKTLGNCLSCGACYEGLATYHRMLKL